MAKSHLCLISSHDGWEASSAHKCQILGSYSDCLDGELPKLNLRFKTKVQ